MAWANPYSPGQVGLSWFPDQVQDVGVSAGRAVSLTVDSSATETISGCYVGVGGVTGAGYMLAEVYPVASVVPGAVTTSSFVPNGTLTGSGSTWRAQPANSTTGADLADAINNGTVVTTTYDEYEGSLSAHTRFELNFPTAGALWPANQRVVSGAVVFSAAVTDSTGQLQVWYNGAGTRVLLGTVTLTTDIQTYSVPIGEINPVSNLPWNRGQVQDLDATSGFGFRPLTGTAKPVRIYDMRVDLDWVAEDRVAVGALALTQSSSLAWATVPLVVPNSGAPNWAKAAATTYTVVVRPPTGPQSTPASFTVRCLGQTGVTTLPQGSIPYRPVLGTGGVVVSEGDAQPLAMAVAFDVNASATDSADGQPYLFFVSTTDTPPAGQTLDGAAVASYTMMRMLVSLTTPVDVVSEWQILGPGPVVLDSGQITQAQIQDDGQFLFTADLDSVYLIEIPVSVTLAAVTTYTVTWEITSSTSGFVHPFLLWTAEPGGVSGHGDPATYGGTTLRFATVNALDWPVTLSTQPNPVTGLQVVQPSNTTDQIGCNPADVPYNEVSWDPTTAADADFAYYELERTTDGGTTWALIGRITDPLATTYADEEAPFTLTVQYRVRQVRAGDLIPSTWTTSDQVVLDAPACVLYLSSNLLPGSGLAYNQGDTTTWRFPSAGEVQYAAPTGADYQTALIPTEWRGDVWEADLTVWQPDATQMGLTPPGGMGRWAFDDLIALTRAQVPYICVRDDTGRVWYADVQADTATRDERSQAHTHRATVLVTELTATPAVVDMEATVLGTADAWWDWRDGQASRSGTVADRTGNGFGLTPTAGTYGLPLAFGPEVEDDPLILCPGFSDELVTTPDPGVEGDFLDVAWDDEENGIPTSTNRMAAHQGDDTGNNAGWYVRTLPGNVPQVAFSPDGTAGAVVPITAGTQTGPGRWRKRVVFESDGAGGSMISFYKQDPTLPRSAILDPVTASTWDLLGPVQTSPFPPTVYQSGYPVSVSGGDTIGANGTEYNGLLYRLVVRDSTGLVLCDLDPALAQRPYDVVQGGAGEDWTFSRALTTNSTRIDVIARACAVNGNNSYWSGGSIFNVGAGDSLTAAASLWEQSSAAALNGTIGKSAIDLNPTDEACWGVGDIASSGGFNTLVSDGTGAPGTGFVVQAMDPQPDEGEVTAVGIVIDRTGNDLYSYADGTAPAAADISGIGSMSNAQTFKVGGFSNYGQGSFICAAVFTRALTAEQMAQLADEMTADRPPEQSAPFLYSEA